MLNDLEIIAAVDAMTRDQVNAALPSNDLPIPLGAQCHRSRGGLVRREWEKAREAYFRQTGIDALDCIRRREAELRNAQNAPELHVERR